MISTLFGQEIKLFVAAKALIRYQDKILILRESDQYADGTRPGLFDVPGGRIIPGEQLEESLCREVQEETGLEIKIGKPFFVGEWRPVVRKEQWHVVGIFFECFTSSNQVILSKDHDEYQWIIPSQFKTVSLHPRLGFAFEEYLAQRS